MDDLINRQAAIEACLRYNGVGWAWSKILDEIKEIPSAQPEQRWIPCSEQLPTKKTEVIYSLENRYVCTGYMTDRDYNGDEMELHWEDMESGALIYPEAWMPLPAPYDPLHGAMNPPEDDITDGKGEAK